MLSDYYYLLNIINYQMMFCASKVIETTLNNILPIIELCEYAV